MTDEELMAMARLAQRDDRMASGALYGDLADRIEELVKERDQHWDSFVHWRNKHNKKRLRRQRKLAAYRATIEETSSHNKGENHD